MIVAAGADRGSCSRGPMGRLSWLALSHRIWSCAWAFVTHDSQIISILAFWQSIDCSGELRFRDKTGPKRYFFQARDFQSLPVFDRGDVVTCFKQCGRRASNSPRADGRNVRHSSTTRSS